jgi:hypothetical protein
MKTFVLEGSLFFAKIFDSHDTLFCQYLSFTILCDLINCILYVHKLSP